MTKEQWDALLMLQEELAHPGNNILRKALVSESDLVALADAISHIGKEHSKEIQALLSQKHLKTQVQRDRLAEIAVNDAFYKELHYVIKNHGQRPDLPVRVDQSQPHTQGYGTSLRVRDDAIDAAVLTSQGVLFLYRQGIAEPIAIKYPSLAEAEAAYKQL